MRIYEIERNVDKDRIAHLFQTWFNFTGDFEIDDDGYVSSDGNVILANMPYNGRLPVKFNQIGRLFNCNDYKVSSLEGFPRKILGPCYFSGNSLTSLEGMPKHFYSSLYINNNKLTSLVGGPETVNGDFLVHQNPLQTLDGLPSVVDGELTFTITKTLPILKVLNVQHVQKIEVFPANDGTDRIGDILNKYKGQGRTGVIRCAAELSSAGFKDNARL